MDGPNALEHLQWLKGHAQLSGEEDLCNCIKKASHLGCDLGCMALKGCITDATFGLLMLKFLVTEAEQQTKDRSTVLLHQNEVWGRRLSEDSGRLLLCGTAASCVKIDSLKADDARAKGILVSELRSRMLGGVLVAASLSHEVLSLRIVALTGATLTECGWATAILFGTIIFEHILRMTHKPCSAVAMAVGTGTAYLMCCWNFGEVTYMVGAGILQRAPELWCGMAILISWRQYAQAALQSCILPFEV